MFSQSIIGTIWYKTWLRIWNFIRKSKSKIICSDKKNLEKIKIEKIVNLFISLYLCKYYISLRIVQTIIIEDKYNNISVILIKCL